MNTHYHVFETKLGFAGIAWNEDGIVALPPADPDRAAAKSLRQGASLRSRRRTSSAVIDQAKRYFAGEQIDFDADRARSRRGRSFRRSIYDALRKVGFGETVTYGELAKRAGASRPQAAQDVGVAMARNPVPLIIPCHRVLAAGGKLGGFSAPGRTEAKERMLALEGVFVGNQPRLL